MNTARLPAPRPLWAADRTDNTDKTPVSGARRQSFVGKVGFVRKGGEPSFAAIWLESPQRVHCDLTNLNSNPRLSQIPLATPPSLRCGYVAATLS